MKYFIREIKDNEIILLEQFLYEAIFVPPDSPVPPKSIVESAELQVYIKDFGREQHDHALIAESDGKAVGAVWARIMNDYGHIDDETPSLAVSLYREYRGHGIGTALVQAMLRLLQNKGYQSVSLAVQKSNYALDLYVRAGFKIIREKDSEYIMVNSLNLKL